MKPGPSPRRMSAKRSVARISLERELLRHFARLEPGVVLDVGSKRSPYRDKIPHTRYLRLDIDPRRQADLCCDIQDIRSEPEAFDTVIATEVLEHVREPQRAVDEIRRVLKPGGVCILSTRFMHPIHGDPHDYYRFTWDSLRHLFRAFTSVEVHHHGNRLQALWQLCEHGRLKPLFLLLSPLVAGVHVRKTKTPLGFVVYAVK